VTPHQLNTKLLAVVDSSVITWGRYGILCSYSCVEPYLYRGMRECDGPHWVIFEVNHINKLVVEQRCKLIDMCPTA
jgi:hypothetical protein